MIKLIVFDLDSTLAPLGEPISEATASHLRRYVKDGIRIAIASGKPTYYLCGLCRQAALPDTILIGENGAAIEFGVDLPPKTSVTLPYSDAAKETIELVRRGLEKALPHLWYQPNRVALTPFFSRDTDADDIAAFLRENEDSIRDVIVYRQCDCYDIVPLGIDKGAGLSELCRMLSITESEVIAVGDGINDAPMLDLAGTAIGINYKDPSPALRNFTTIDEALLYIDTLVTKE